MPGRVEESGRPVAGSGQQQPPPSQDYRLVCFTDGGQSVVSTTKTKIDKMMVVTRRWSFYYNSQCKVSTDERKKNNGQVRPNSQFLNGQPDDSEQPVIYCYGAMEKLTARTCPAICFFLLAI